MFTNFSLILIVLGLTALITACTGPYVHQSHRPAKPRVETNVCDNADNALTDKGFVIVTSPVSGQRVKPGFTVTGCSRSFESNVPWQLTDTQGNILAAGAAMGGGVDGFGKFSFVVNYSVSETQFGVLHVMEDDPSDGEGNPPKDNEIPIILKKK
jgi:hypothetical protein